MDPLNLIVRALPSDIRGVGRTLSGLIPYNAPTRIAERGKVFTEVIRPGAFKRAFTAGSRDVVSFFNHNPHRVLGRTASGTLRLTDEADGLRFEIDLPESAADVRELVARGDLRGASFQGGVVSGGDKWTGDVCELLDLVLVEVGPVVSPAYDASAVVLRSGQAAPGTTARAAALVNLMGRAG